MSFRVAFCVSGLGRLARAAIMSADDLGIQPVAMILDEKADPALADRAAEAGIVVTRLDPVDRERFDRELVSALEAAAPDLVLLTFNKLVPDQLQQRFPRRIVNVHMSLLPAFTGFGALKKAIERGVKYAGATLHLIGEGIDDGPIIAQCVSPLAPAAGTQDLGRQLYPKLLKLTLQTLAWYASDRVLEDGQGRIWIHGASYEDSMTCPRVESRIEELADAILADQIDVRS